MKPLLALLLAAVVLPRALAQTMPMHSAPAMPGRAPLPAGHSPKAAPMRSMKVGARGMSMTGAMQSTTDLADPMSQEGSGTSWLPASSPMYGYAQMHNGNMIMLHGAIAPRYVNVGSRRGDRRFDAPSWLMGMLSHPLDSRSQIGVRAMLSLDPLLEGGYGYPDLYATGETWHGQSLHDRQHPHELVSEFSVAYSRKIGGDRSAYIYVADPGEPALGPPAFMHRLLGYDYLPAPIGHHWEDATHIVFGVATLGLNLGGKVKVEGSKFTGRDPNENRTNFDKPRFDSQSARISYNPDPGNAFQISQGFIYSPDGDAVNQHRLTASWLYNKGLGIDANLSTSLIYGQNDETQGFGKSNAFLAEADYQHHADTIFARAENVQKSGKDLVLADSLLRRKYALGTYTIGYIRDLAHGKGIDTGLGAAITAGTNPAALNPYYGSGTHLGFEVFFRLRPSRMGGGKDGTANMRGMDMRGMAPAEATAPDSPDNGVMPGMSIGR